MLVLLLRKLIMRKRKSTIEMISIAVAKFKHPFRVHSFKKLVLMIRIMFTLLERRITELSVINLL